MTSLQKAVKYIAMTIAILLIVSIVGKFVKLGAAFNFIMDDSTEAISPKDIQIDGEEIEKLNIKINAADFSIKAGDKFDIESNSDNFTVKVKGSTLTISEKKRIFYFNSYNAKLVLTVPKDYNFSKAAIETGAGRLNIEELITEKLSLELGAGEVDIKKLYASKSADINGGTGKVTIADSTLSKLDLDMGVGELNFTGELTGKCEIETGVGKADIKLTGNAQDYRIEIDKGLGKATIDGVEMQDGSIYGNGNTELELIGGIGEIKLDFENSGN